MKLSDINIICVADLYAFWCPFV